MNPVRAFLERHSVAAYFALAFIISWGAVLAVIGGRAGIPASKEENDRLFPVVYLAMLAGPSVAGIVMTVITGGAKGVRELRSRLLRWRVGIRWYAVALLTAPLVTGFVLLALSRFSREFIPGVFTARDPAAVLLFGLPVALGAGLFEELGWTGFAIPRMRVRFRMIATGMSLGMLWAAWHILVNFWGSIGGISLVFMLPVLLATAGLGMLPAYRVLMVWVHDRTRSLLVAMLMHASLTASLIILRPAANGMALVVYELVWAGVTWAFIAVIAVRARQVSGRRPTREGGLAA